MMAVIFDLDQTLVNTRVLRKYRENRQWREIKFHLNKTHVYGGLKLLVSTLNRFNIPTAIVTNAPSNYVHSILTYHELQIRNVVAYHDTIYHKPHPAPILKSMDLMNCHGSDIVAIGDDIKDVIAAKNAGIMSCASLWDCDCCKDTLTMLSDYAFNSPENFAEFVLRFHELDISD